MSRKAHALAAQLTSQAQAQYDAGRFEDAAESYRRAYAVVPAPELLFNLGQCQRLLGRPQRAVKYFEAYLRLRPDAPHRPLVEQLIEESKLIEPPPSVPKGPPAVGALQRAAPDPLATPPKPSRHVKVMPLPPLAPLPEPGSKLRLTTDERDARQNETPALYEQWWFWTAIGVVAAGAAVATYAIVESQDDSEPSSTLGTVAWN